MARTDTKKTEQPWFANILQLLVEISVFKNEVSSDVKKLEHSVPDDSTNSEWLRKLIAVSSSGESSTRLSQQDWIQLTRAVLQKYIVLINTYP